MKPAIGLIALLVACADVNLATKEQPLVGGDEIELDAPETIAAAARQDLDRVVFDGTRYLAFWGDARRNFPSAGGRLAPHFARISIAGDVVDVTGVSWWPGDRGRFSGRTAAACDGAGGCFAVTTYDAANSNDDDLAGVRIVDGEVVDATPIVVDAGEGDQQLLDVTWDGSGYRVLYRDHQASPSSTWSRRVMPDGTVGSAGVILPRFGVQLGCGGGACLLVSVNGDAVVGQLLGGDGTPGPEFTIGTATEDKSIGGVQWAGSRFWVVWVVGRDDQFLRGARVTAAGVVEDPGGVAIVGDARRFENPSLSFDGTDAVVAWADSSGNYRGRAARLGSDGTVRDPGGVEIAPGEARSNRIEAACAPGGCYVAYRVYSDGHYDVRGKAFALPGAFGEDRIVAASANAQVWPSVSGRDGTYVAIWKDSRDTESVRGARFAAGVGETAPFAIAPAPGAFENNIFDAAPIVAQTADTTLIAWVEARGIVVQAFDSSGAAKSEPTLASPAPYATLPSLAAGDDGFLLAWRRHEPSAIQNGETWVRAIDAGGTPASGPLMVAERGRDGVHVAWNGESFVAVWDDHEPSGAGDVVVMRISPAGQALDTAPIAVGAAPMVHASNANVACGDEVCLVTWQVQPGGLQGVRVARDGTIADAAPIELTTNRVAAYDVAFDGAWFSLAWLEPDAVWVRRFAAHDMADPAGALRLHEGPLFDAQTSQPSRVAVAGDGRGNAIVLYDRFDDDPAVRSLRVKAREFGDVLPEPEEPEDPDDQGSESGCCGANPGAELPGALLVLGLGWLGLPRRRGRSRSPG